MLWFRDLDRSEADVVDGRGLNWDSMEELFDWLWNLSNFCNADDSMWVKYDEAVGDGVDDEVFWRAIKIWKEDKNVRYVQW